LIFRKNIEVQSVFFLRGFQRSGTNWVCNLLNLHPDISCTGEFHLQEIHLTYTNILNRSKTLIGQNHKIFTSNYNTFIKNTIIEYNKNKRFVGDRTPCALDRLYLKDCKYILIIRDGRDIVVSWIYHLFRINHTFGEEMENKKLIFHSNKSYFENNKKELLNNYWVKKLAVGWNNRLKRDLIMVKSKISKNQIMVIKYEDLITNTEIIRNEMYSFLGADPYKANKLTNITKPGFKNHNANSHYRKGESNRWKLYFTKEQLRIFERYAYDSLKNNNYNLYS